MRPGLVVPRHLAGVHVHGDERVGEEVVSRSSGLVGIRRCGIPGPEDVEVRLRIVRSRHPHLRAAVPRCVDTRPGVRARIARLHRHSVELPLQLAGFGIERLQESRRIEIVSGADEHVVADHDGRRRREVLRLEAGDHLVPPLLAGFGLETDQIIVRRLHVQIVVPHAEAAVADVRPATCFPVVVPQLASIARVHGPRVVGRREIEDAVHLQNRRADARAAAADLAGSFAADDHRRSSPANAAESAASATHVAGTGRHLADPCQREMLHRRLVDLRERAVSLAGIIAGVGRPRIRQRLEDRRRIEPLPLRGQHDRQENDRCRHQELCDPCHFTVTKYAVMS